MKQEPLTVRQLIDKLKTCDPNAIAYTPQFDGEIIKQIAIQNVLKDSERKIVVIY